MVRFLQGFQPKSYEILHRKSVRKAKPGRPKQTGDIKKNKLAVRGLVCALPTEAVPASTIQFSLRQQKCSSTS